MGQFVARDNVIVGTVHHAGELYTLRPLGGAMHAFVRLDSEQLLPQHSEAWTRLDHTRASRTSESHQEKAVALPPQSNSSSLVTIDVLIAYTNMARMGAGGTSAVEAYAQLAVDEANTTYINSGVALRLELVRAAYTDTPEYNTLDDLPDVTYTWDGRFDEVHPLRDQYEADVVSLMGDYEACGAGWLSSPVSEGGAFSVIHIGCVGASYPLAHEIGHNLGASHGPGVGTNPYNEHGNGYASSGWRTVMADTPTSSTRIPYWSNPDVSYGGVPTGTVQDHDNARVLDENAAIVAGYRGGAPSGAYANIIVTSQSTNTIGPNGGLLSFDLGFFYEGGAPPPYPQYWVIATLPNGNPYGPVFGPSTAPAESVSLTANVPTRAPAGDYTVTAYVGNYPSDIFNSDSFTFTKTNGGGSFATRSAPFAERVSEDDLAWRVTDKASGQTQRTVMTMAETGVAAPAKLEAYPNPASNRLAVAFTLEAGADVTLTIYDMLGRQVATLAEGAYEVGRHEAGFDASSLPAGVYLARLQTHGTQPVVQQITIAR